MDKVTSNKEKQFAYRIEYGRLNKAIKGGFYLEALVIGYALIEDRCVSFLHYAGIVTRDHESLAINKKVLPYVRTILGKNEKDRIVVRNISTKIDIIRALLELNEKQAEYIDDNIEQYAVSNNKKRVARKGYMLDVCSQIDETVDRKYVLELLDTIKPWLDKRNKLIHALLNQTVSSSDIAQRECAESVYGITRLLDDKLVKTFKKGNGIRRKYRIQ